MIVGSILSVIVGVILLGLGLVVLLAGLVTADTLATIGGTVVLVIGVLRLLTTIRSARRLRQVNPMRFVIACHLQFFVIGAVSAGIGLFSVVTGLGAVDAGARISGAFILLLSVIGLGFTARSMRRMRKYTHTTAIRFMFTWSIQVLIVSIVLVGLGLYLVIWALGTRHASNTGYAVLGGVLLLIGLSNTLWYIGRLRMID
jgi:hypothetical protein